MKTEVTIKGKTIGPGHPVYVIAELSANHGQSFERACETIRAMKDAGADAVKLQTYTPDTMTIQSDRPEFRVGKGTMWEGKTLYELYEEAYTPWEWQPKLKKLAEDLKMDCFSTPFDATAVDFLEKMDVPAYKIASFEIVDLPLIERAAKTRKPLILSTGMATEEEILEAMECARHAGNERIVLLKCTSAYPAAAEEMNLRTIPDMYERFGVPIGLSDHSLELAVPVAAVALGACVIEKHFCLSRKEKGPDTAFSLEPEEFRAMATAVRQAQTALGSVQFAPTEKEKASRVFRRSLFTVRDIAKEETFTAENVRCIRPGYGLPPKEIKNVLGRKARTAISRGTPLSWENVLK